MMSCRIPTPLRPGAHSKALLADLLRAVAAAADGKKGLGRLSIATASSAELRCFHSSHGNGRLQGIRTFCVRSEDESILDRVLTGTTAAAEAPAIRGAVRTFLPLAAAGGFFTSVALVYRHLHHAGATATAGAGNRRPPGLATFTLCASVGLLEYLLFVVQAPVGGGVDHGAARELGLAALRALPAAATATFFLGILLIIVGHIRAGGEGGGGAAAGNGPIEAPVGLLAKMAIGAAAGLVCLMAMALYGAC